jgi:hypothetical protein
VVVVPRGSFDRNGAGEKGTVRSNDELLVVRALDEVGNKEESGKWKAGK